MAEENTMTNDNVTVTETITEEEETQVEVNTGNLHIVKFSLLHVRCCLGLVMVSVTVLMFVLFHFSCLCCMLYV